MYTLNFFGFKKHLRVTTIEIVLEIKGLDAQDIQNLCSPKILMSQLIFLE